MIVLEIYDIRYIVDERDIEIMKMRYERLKETQVLRDKETKR